jgi:hypothetical protein
MSHEEVSHHPQIYWMEKGLSPRMCGMVKQSKAVAGPNQTVRISWLYDGSRAYITGALGRWYRRKTLSTMFQDKRTMSR